MIKIAMVLMTVMLLIKCNDTKGQVPDNPIVSLSNVCSVIGGGIDDLQACFDNANPAGFDPLYNDPSGNFLSEFRNYQHIVAPNGWDISTSVFVASNDINLTAQAGIGFSPDGSKVYVQASGTGDMLTWLLNTPWDITSRNLPSVVIGDPTPKSYTYDIHITDSETVFYMGGVGSSVYQHTMTVAGDISASTHIYTFETNPAAPDVYNITGISLSPDEAKMFIKSNDGFIRSYTMSIPGDLSTATRDPNNISFTPSTDGVLAISPDGYHVIYDDAGILKQHTLLTPFDMGTINVPLDKTFNISTIVQPKGSYFRSDGLKYYINSWDNENIYEYDMQ